MSDSPSYPGVGIAARLWKKLLSKVAPTDKQVLAFNAGTDQWEPTTDPGATLPDPVTPAHGGFGVDASAFTGVMQAAGGAFSASLTPTLNGITGTGDLSITRAAPAAAANAAAIGITGADGGAGTAGVAASGTWTLAASDSYPVGSTITLSDANGHTQTFRFDASGMLTNGNPYQYGVVGLGLTATQMAQATADIFNQTNTAGFGVPAACNLLMTVVRSGTTVTLTDTGTGAAGNSAITDAGGLPGSHSSTMSGGVTAVTGGNGTTITYTSGAAGSNGGSAGRHVFKNGSTTALTLSAGVATFGTPLANAQLANSSLSVTTVGALTGGGAVSLGGTLSLSIAASDATHVGTMSAAQATQLAALPSQILSGTNTLSSGTVTITAAITASSRIVVTVKDANPGAGSLTVGLEVPSAGRSAGTSFVVRANVAAGTINTLDTSTFDWIAVG